jgi:hypothetical protein
MELTLEGCGLGISARNQKNKLGEIGGFGLKRAFASSSNNRELEPVLDENG